MIMSSPSCRLTGAADLCLAVSWSKPITRVTSWKLRPADEQPQHFAAAD
jgi:hypothetical protein